MGKRKIILYDDNFDYVQRLASFIESNNGITVGIFTSLEKLEDYIGGEPEDFYVLQDCEACRRLYSKSGIHGVLITDKRELEDAGIYEYVYRYRAASDITDIIMNKMNCENKEDVKEREMVKTYAITSPVYRADIDNILIEISKSTTKKVLIIDFRLITAWEDICNREESTNLSDIMFLIRESNDRILETIKDSVFRVNNIDIIFGIVDEGELAAITNDDIDKVITGIITHTQYERIIFVVESVMFEQIPKSIIGKNLIWIIRDTQKEDDVLKKYFKKGAPCLNTYSVKECVDELDMSYKEYNALTLESGVLKGVVRDIVSQGII